MLVTLFDIEISNKVDMSLNADDPMLVTLDGIVTFIRLVLQNAPLPMLVIQFGMVMFVSEPHPLNA